MVAPGNDSTEDRQTRDSGGRQREGGGLEHQEIGGQEIGSREKTRDSTGVPPERKREANDQGRGEAPPSPGSAPASEPPASNPTGDRALPPTLPPGEGDAPLSDRDGLYFFPDQAVGETRIRWILQQGSSEERAWVISHLLRFARWDDIWSYVTRQEVREVFFQLELPDRLRQAWARMLKLGAR